MTLSSDSLLLLFDSSVTGTAGTLERIKKKSLDEMRNT
jgi:hypothetical protein